jgi:hypothetical protein
VAVGEREIKKVENVKNVSTKRGQKRLRDDGGARRG